ncbi:MAG: S41 family peptidase [Bacteroidota bacterium]|nr:S41 family peptidase [Bacteroidota bacterium]
MSKIRTIYLPIIVSLSIAIGVLVGAVLDFPINQELFVQNKADLKLKKIMYLLDNEYYRSVDTDSVLDNVIGKVLKELDPYSAYIPSDDVGSLEEEMKGNFVGIGVNFYLFKDTLTVVKTIKGGPSEIAGIRAGDRILYVDNDTVFGKKAHQPNLMSRFKGKLNSKLQLVLYRPSDNKLHKFELKRDLVPIKSIVASFKLTQDIGYIKINRFAETTNREFDQALIKLKNNNISTLVLDLRDNSGGYVEAVIEILDHFFDENQLLFTSKNRYDEQQEFRTTAQGDFKQGSLYVLINENSASASEIVAGAIQDTDRGIIIGKRSYGKGTVQKEVLMDDGAILRLTVAEYFTPSGRSIQKEENPNIPYDLIHQNLKNQHNSDQEEYYTKNNRVVYAKGGILPDIQIDDTTENQSVIFMMQSDLLINFVFEIIDNNRAFYQDISKEQLFANLTKNDYFVLFNNYLKNKNIHLYLEKDKSLISKYIKAEFCRQLFSDQEYYRVLLDNDIAIDKVLEDLEKSAKE